MLQPLPAPQKFRFAEMGATVACPATAQQDAWHRSDHSNDAGTRLLTIMGSIYHSAPVHCINARTTSEPTLRGVFAEAAAKICPDVKLDVRKDQDAKKKKEEHETQTLVRHGEKLQVRYILGDEERAQTSCSVTSKRPCKKRRCLERNLSS